MTTVRVSVMENYGNLNEEDGEEAQWGPYVSYQEFDKPFAEITPADFLVEGATAVDEDGDDEMLTFDIYSVLEDGNYCRLNLLITKEED